jgi:hypothetical protein
MGLRHGGLGLWGTSPCPGSGSAADPPGFGPPGPQFWGEQNDRGTTPPPGSPLAPLATRTGDTLAGERRCSPSIEKSCMMAGVDGQRAARRPSGGAVGRASGE